MNEPKQKLIDQQLLVKLDSLRKSGALNLGESNWYNARRPAIGGIESAVSSASASHDGAADTAVACVEAPRALSRLERKTIEKILTSHGVAHPSQA